MKKIIIVGAGPGGLAAGLMLSSRGFDVHIYEKNERPGGRSRRISLGDYHFDLGPTFLMYLEVLKEIFSSSGFDLHEELTLKRLDPLYKLFFPQVEMTLSSDTNKNRDLYEGLGRGAGKAYEKWLMDQKKKFNALRPIMEKPFPSFLNALNIDVLKALPQLHPFTSVYSHLKSYCSLEPFIHSLSFQAKYLGMASSKAPSIFTILPYLEHALGLYHVEGGINRIHDKMAALIAKQGGQLHYASPVTEILVENGIARGVKLHDGSEDKADAVIVNADFAYAMTNLVNTRHLSKYTPRKIARRKYSISTVMVYLGLDTQYAFNHHALYFSKDYNKYLKTLVKNELSADLSYYLHNPVASDTSLAPPGHSCLYLLAPVPNLKAPINWEEVAPTIRDFMIDDIERRHGVDIRSHIKAEKIITPKDWEQDENVYLGAVFNLAHGFNQLLHKRPHNEFEDIKNMYLVGGGTHPGSGLPTIYQSASIVCSLPFFKKA